MIICQLFQDIKRIRPRGRVSLRRFFAVRFPCAKSLGLAVEDFESVETLRRDLQYRDEFSSECLRINQQSKPCNDESNVARGSFTAM